MLKVIDTAVPIACWSCSVAHNESTLFCPHCSKIQPPPGGDFFSVFELEPRLNLDLEALERQFHRLSRRLHPDRFARAETNEKQWSLADTALLNDAYRTLKDPLRRTEYLLKLHGAQIDAPAAAVEGKTPGQARTSRVPADLLEEVFDLNLQLEQILRSRKMGEQDPALEENLLQAKRKFETLVLDVDRDLHSEWNDWDAGDASTRKTAQKAMVALLERRRYLSNMVRDVTEALAAKF